MRAWTTFQLQFYLELQKDLQQKLAYIREHGFVSEELDARRQLAVVSERVVSARRNMRYKQAIIDSGVLGPMPEVFANGKPITMCPSCRKRRDTVDMLSIQRDQWVWLRTCQECNFHKRSKMTIEAKDRVHEKTAAFSQHNVNEKMCSFCGEIKHINEYKAIGLNKYDDVPVRYDYICKDCRVHISKDPENTGIRKPSPFIYNPQDPTKSRLNPAFFHTREDLLNPEKLTHIRDMVKDINDMVYSVEEAEQDIDNE